METTTIMIYIAAVLLGMAVGFIFQWNKHAKRNINNVLPFVVSGKYNAEEEVERLYKFLRIRYKQTNCDYFSRHGKAGGVSWFRNFNGAAVGQTADWLTLYVKYIFRSGCDLVLVSREKDAESHIDKNQVYVHIPVDGYDN